MPYGQYLVTDYIYNLLLQTSLQALVLKHAEHIKLSKSWHAKFTMTVISKGQVFIQAHWEPTKA